MKRIIFDVLSRFIEVFRIVSTKAARSFTSARWSCCAHLMFCTNEYQRIGHDSIKIND